MKKLIAVVIALCFASAVFADCPCAHPKPRPPFHPPVVVKKKECNWVVPLVGGIAFGAIAVAGLTRHHTDTVILVPSKKCK